MRKMNGFKAVVAMALGAWVVGCSNLSAPVSMSDNHTTTTAAIGDKTFRDIAIAGTLNLWGLSNEAATGSGDYWIYKYNSSTDLWEKSPHYGKAIAVSQSGKCWHINASNQIWWGTMTSNGTISNPTGIVTLSDIGCGYNPEDLTNEWVWIKGANSSGTISIWKYRLNSSNNWAWVNMTGSLTSIQTVSCESRDGDWGIVVANGGNIYECSSETSGWTNVSIPGVTASSAANNRVGVKRVARSGFYIYDKKGTGSWTRVATNAKSGTTPQVDDFYVWYINTSGIINQIVFP